MWTHDAVRWVSADENYHMQLVQQTLFQHLKVPISLDWVAFKSELALSISHQQATFVLAFRHISIPPGRREIRGVRGSYEIVSSR